MKNPKLKIWCFQLMKYSKLGRWSRSFYKLFLPEGLSTFDAYDLVEAIGYKKCGPKHYYCPEKSLEIHRPWPKIGVCNKYKIAHIMHILQKEANKSIMYTSIALKSTP